MSRSRLSIAALALAGALSAASLAGCGSSGSSSGSAAMTLATPTWNAGIASIAVSQKMGYFKAEGLNVNVILTDSGTTQVQQIGAGKVQTGAVSPEPVIIGDQPGKDLGLKYFMSYYKKNIYGLSVPEDSSIKSIADLKGKTVGAISLSSVSVTQAQVGLKEAGVDPSSVKFVAIGTGGQQATAIKKGQVDAVALLDTSFQTLDNQGIKLRPIDVPGASNLTSGGLAAKASELTKEPGVYEKIGRAVAKGVVFAKENPEAAIKILYDAHPEAKPSGLSEAAAIAGSVKILQSRLANLGADAADGHYGEIDPSQLTANVDFLRKAGLITSKVAVDKLYTNDLIAKINDFDAAAVRKQADNYDG